MSARVLSLLCSLSRCPCSSLVDRSNSLCISSWVIVWLLCKTGRPSLMKKSSRAQPSLASSPHPSVSGLVMTVCACVDFPRKTWEFGYHRLLARLLSATVRRFSLLERQVLRLREEQTRAIRNVYDGNAIFPRFSWENQRMRRQSLPGH